MATGNENSHDDRFEPHPGPGSDDGGAFADAVARWTAETRVDDAVAERARRQWRQRIEAESTSILGVLVELAERDRPALVDIGGQRVRGRTIGVAEDFVALRSDQGQDVLVRTACIDVVRGGPGRSISGSVGGAFVPVSLAGILGPVAADRPDVAVWLPGDAIVRGRLQRAGIDAIGVHEATEDRSPTWVRIESIRALVLDP